MKHSRLLPLSVALTLALVAPVASSSGEPVAVAAKKKCKKALWKCAPKHLHLEASGVVDLGEGGKQIWSAEVEMRKWRASVGQVQYAQDSGGLTVQNSWSAPGPSYELPTCTGNISYSVPRQTMRLPRGDGFRFNAFITFYLIGDRKNKYDFIVDDAYELAVARGTQTCSSDSSQAQFPYYFKVSNNFEFLARGRPGARRLAGSKAAKGDTLRWAITKK
jgi:hypothetical protein